MVIEPVEYRLHAGIRFRPRGIGPHFGLKTYISGGRILQIGKAAGGGGGHGGAADDPAIRLFRHNHGNAMVACLDLQPESGLAVFRQRVNQRVNFGLGAIVALVRMDLSRCGRPDPDRSGRWRRICLP